MYMYGKHGLKYFMKNTMSCIIAIKKKMVNNINCACICLRCLFCFFKKRIKKQLYHNHIVLKLECYISKAALHDNILWMTPYVFFKGKQLESCHIWAATIPREQIQTNWCSKKIKPNQATNENNIQFYISLCFETSLSVLWINKWTGLSGNFSLVHLRQDLCGFSSVLIVGRIANKG
jgi:hypothetical protein